MTGWAFDRAAEYYDATRGLPEAVAQKITALLSSELAGRGHALEIGVGTGRIALPLHAAGAELVGTDLARPMLDKLVANAGGRQPFPLTMGDATALPFGDGSFGAVLASHVLHLIPPWRLAVDEAIRVLGLDGVLLVDFGGGQPAPWSDGVRTAMADLGVHHLRPGVSVARHVADHVGGRATARQLEPIVMSNRRSLAEDLDQWERQLHSWTWQYPADQMAAACDAVRRWAASEGFVLEDKVELDYVISWWAFDKGDPTGRLR